MVDFINFRIDEKAVPATLQEMPDEAGFAVEEAELDEVAPGEVESGADEQRHRCVADL